MKILIVEDNRDIADNIADYLESLGWEFDFAADGITAVQKATGEEFDAIILDVMLPGMNGLSVCQKLREELSRRLPILMLTARDTLPDKLNGFDAGADDYLVKPFALEELAARLKALTERNRPDFSRTLSVADLTLDPETRQVQRGGQEVQLNNTCYRILHTLMLASPKVVSRGELEQKLWQDYPPGSDVLRSSIYTLRSKVDKPFATPLLTTLHGVGWKISEGGSK